MKKNLCVLFIGVFFASCTDCKDCTLGDQINEVCRDDFDTNEDYQAAILALEQIGFDCK